MTLRNVLTPHCAVFCPQVRGTSPSSPTAAFCAAGCCAMPDSAAGTCFPSPCPAPGSRPCTWRETRSCTPRPECARHRHPLRSASRIITAAAARRTPSLHTAAPWRTKRRRSLLQIRSAVTARCCTQPACCTICAARTQERIPQMLRTYSRWTAIPRLHTSFSGTTT